MKKPVTRALPLFATLCMAGVAAAQNYVWLEGEKPTSSNYEGNPHGWGNSHFMSGGAWMHVSVDEGKIKDTVPEEGILFKYEFEAPAAGEYEVWARVGFEGIRSPIDWRVDNAEFQRTTADDLTTDLMEIAFWCELAWLQLGKAQLAAGKHTLEFRLPKIVAEDGKAQRIVFALDCACVSLEPFFPNSHWKPGEDWQSEKDKQAAEHVFKVPATAAGTRATVPLNGVWEVTRNDEQTPPADVAQPMVDFPAQFRWTAINVPSDKNKSRPDLVFAHRLWYRTRVDVPADMAGRGFALRFPENNLNTTVFVNGEQCGFFAYPFADFSVDITAAVKPGVNEIWVGIRDAWYGRSTNPDNPLKLRKTFNYPLGLFGQGFQDFAWPVWNHSQSGILQTPELLVMGGPVYASDMFAKPSVSKKQLAVEATIINPTKAAVNAVVALEAVNTKTGETEKKFAPVSVALAAGEEKMVEVAEAWANPKLWWPDEPNLYWIRATVTPVSPASPMSPDVSNTRFGFREWDWSTREFKLNGLTWNVWCDCFTAGSKEEWLKFYKEKNQTVMRFWGTTWLNGMHAREALDFMDENGVLCRRSGIFDGEAIGYWVIENDQVLKDLYDSPIKIQLFNNWSKQVVARVRGERNHPSVMIWSLENEVLFINCINLYGGYMDQFEEEITKCSDAVMALDPTRPTMVDGGGATKANTLPVHGDHYVTAAPNLYPPFAYETNTKGGGRGRWEWDEKRPRFIGEDYYMTGLHPEVSYFQGDSAFTGKPVVGVGIWNRILQEGYRWSGQCAWHYWLSQYDTHQDQYTAYAARAVFSKQWNWTFGAGETATRTFGVFNDSRYADPITFTWTLMVDGKKAASGSHKLTIEPGARKDVEESIKMPSIRGARQEAELVLSLAVNGKEVFNEAKAVSILAPQKRAMPGVGKADLVVFDPEGGASKFLAAQKVDFTPVKSLDALPANWKVLLVGSNALDAPESASSRLAALAATGRRVIVLDQENPLRHQGLPAEMAVTTGVGYSMFGQNFTSTVGYTAFLEDTSHPALAGLADKDFFAWVDFESPVYRNIYDKPVRGARSLVQCHHHLRHTALAEIPVGEGLLMACQLNLSARFAENIVARQLVLNLLGHAATYKLEYYPVTACLDGAPLLKAALDTMGLQYNTAADPVAALGQKTPSILVVNASPETLAKLAANLTAVKKFNDGGGSLVLCGVTPEGLADYNKIVGVDHVMRPFQRERVLLPALRSRLTAGLTSSDVALFSSQRIFNWTEGNYVASDVFSHVVDYDEVAPFGTSSFGSYANIVNGFIGADGWPLIINFQKNADDSPYQVPITFPKEYEFNEFTWVGNTFYSPQTRVNLVFGGDRANMLSWPTAPNAEAQTFAIDPPRKASEVTLEIAEWLPVQGKENTIGIDNIALKVKRPADFYNTVKPLVNIGGLMEYEKGKGRVVLCNLLFQENEAVPENAGKKRRILSTMLHNMKAPFASGKTVIAGMNLKYAPVDISTKSTQYRDEKGWFGDRARTFKDFPPGRQRLAGVPFDIYEFATSPVPNALMLKGANIPGDLPAEITGIPVNQKADALFLLQAARVDRRRNPNEAKAGTWFELAKYVVRYVDGETVEIPVMAERDIDNYSQQNPAAVPGAQVAWTKKFDGNDDSAVAYLMQWTNPRPDVAIATLDLLPGKDNAGVPVLIALTAALVE